jgi:hypothetical protein
MRLDRGRSQRPAATFAAGNYLLSPPRLVALAIVAAALFAPSPSFAQTLNLGNAGGDGLFAVYNDSLYNQSSGFTGVGSFNFSNSTDMGGAMLGAGTSLGGVGTVFGSLSADPTASVDPTVNVLGGTFSNSGVGAYIAGLGQTAINVATAAENLVTSGQNQNANGLTATVNGSNYTFTGSIANSGVNVINVNLASGLLKLTNATITLTGSSTEKFVFNITGSSTHPWTWNDVKVVLNGVSGGNVFYNIISSGGGTYGINSGSDLSGTVLNVLGGVSMSIDNSTIEGAVISAGSIDMANSIIAPELPTAAMAGLVSVAVFGHAAFSRRRRRRGRRPPKRT